MFVVGGIVAAGREDHDRRIGEVRQGPKGFQQAAWVFIDRSDAIGLKQLWKSSFHHLSGFQHIRHPGRAAHIILKDIIAAVADAHQVDPGDVTPDAARGIEPPAGFQKPFAGIDQFARDDVIFEDLLLVIHIIDK